MKHYYLATICLVCFLQPKNAVSQNLLSPCGSDYWRGKTLQDPTLFQKNQDYEKGILQVFEQKKVASGTPEQAKILPVVVHIIHDNGAENISDAQVQQAIAWLNQALANQGTFNQGSGTDCGIQLCFAQRTPDGQTTNGITRNQSPLTEMQMESQDIQVKNLNRWNPKDYVNIWLVRSICSTTYGCGVYGYANYPYAHGSNIDGIVIEAAYLTQIGKITGLAHEMGHYLGLYHTFEGGCVNNNCMLDGDRICDTPPDQSTAGVPCGSLVSTCSTDTQSGPFSTDQPDMSWNFMDYGIIACFHDFSADQSTRMNATIDGVRQSLLDSKGCLPPCPAPAVAAFTASATTVPIGGTVSFTNTSQNIGSSLWLIDGVSFETQTNATYTFTTAGTYKITLRISPANPALCAIEEVQMNIQVYCPVTASFTLSDLAPDVNETIWLTNTSENATQTEWFVNGISQGNALDSISFDVLGIFEIRLETSNGACGSTSSLFVYTQEACLNKTLEYEFNPDDASQIYRAYSSAVLMDGNLVIASNMDTFATSACLLTKLKLDGTILWSKQFFRDSHTVSQCLVQATPEGGFALTFTTFNFTGNNYIAKFTTNGALEWMRVLPVSGFTDLAVFPDGSLIVTGHQMVKFSAAGDVLWTKGYGWDAKIIAYPDGGFLTMRKNSVPLTLSRFDANGNVLWNKNFWSDSALSASDFVATPAGDVYVVCIKEFTFNSVFHGVLFKLNPDGAVQWSKSYQQIPLSVYEFDAITLSADGNLVIAGSALADDPGIGPLKQFHLLLKTDPEGNILWSRHRLRDIQTVDLNLLPEGGFFTAGNKNGGSVWLLKTDAQGNTIGCSESPHQVNSLDFDLSDSLATYTLEDIAFSPVIVTASVVDRPLLIDTICAPFCVRPFEICNNQIDDDGDGLFDCLDPECNCTEDQCAPRQANIWYFGTHAGLDFSTDPPTVLTDGNTQAFGISATQCDANGDVLFYSDGEHVFNRFHEVMPNGTLGNMVANFNSIIFPNLDNSSQYFLAIQTNAGNIEILSIDMTLDNGKGDVAGTFLDMTGNTGMAVTKNCNGLGSYWFLTHPSGQNSGFLALNIGQAGPSMFVFSGPPQFMMAIKQLKISPDGRRVACTYHTNALFNTTAVAVYDFDPIVGTVSNLLELASSLMPASMDGVEFSPNGRFLYVTGNQAQHAQVLQYDLEAGNLVAIQASVVVLAIKAISGTSYPQLAPNGKIYVPKGLNFPGSANSLDVIHQPNKAGALCNYQIQGQSLANGSGIGVAPTSLCNVISNNLGKVPHVNIPYDAPDTICVLNTPVPYYIPNIGCETDSLVWKVENLDAQISPGNENAVIQYLNPGSGRLIVTVYTVCGSAADTLDILVAAPLNKTLDLGPDLVVCQNGVFSFNAGSGFTRYLWSDGTADSTTTTLFPGKYWVKVWDLCDNLQTDTITVSIAPGSVLDLGPDLPQQCSGFSTSYQRPANFDSWKWSPDTFLNCTDCPEVTLSPNVSAQWVVVAQTDQGCISVDTLNATIRDTLLFSRDTFVCEGQTLAFLGAQLPADTTAEFFLPAPGMGCDTLLAVHVLGIENSASEVSVTICADAVFEYHGALLPADTVAVFHLSSAQACDSVVTVKVNAFPSLNLTLPMDTTIRIGASVLLEANVNGSGTLDFAWSPPDGLSCIACPDPLANPLDTITYTLAVTDKNGCTTQESVTIRVSEECRIQIPTAFTPNGDGSNDRFRPIMDPCVRTVRLWRIVNRWGQTVFEQINLPATDTGLGWDGSWNGKAHPSDVLVWMAEFEYYDGRRKTERGELTLVR